ncbi:Cu(I)/Ag(I) efflux system protein CusF [Raoultella sp. BIGb0138]|uniref:cation efflux system protein CusF n=1 Tax=Raoultella sp. BIGb0138 TaxID=2485115 RepID=UPI001047C83B|nr:cation efflux system protein CusF [Raoultella sp. BIGb0138]TCW06417.1 Cu(I)/Ag(I) efflux system protein CusF [Raoultella sp. BIGb0138]
MNTVAKTVIFGLLVAALSGAQAAEHQHDAMMHSAPAAQQTPAISATGEVKAIDLENKKVTIAHEAIPAVNWPPMTMRFTLTPQTPLKNIKAGSKVAFTFIQQGNLSLLQDIHLAQ